MAPVSPFSGKRVVPDRALEPAQTTFGGGENALDRSGTDAEDGPPFDRARRLHELAFFGQWGETAKDGGGALRGARAERDQRGKCTHSPHSGREIAMRRIEEHRVDEERLG